MKRLMVVAALIAGLVVAAPAERSVAADAGAEGQFIALTNQVRANNGLAPLEYHDNLTAKARGWAQTMANSGGIFHSNLSDGITVNWYRLGENVGRGPSVESIHNALVASPGHYANLVDPGFRYIGVGVVNHNGVIYVSEVFMEPQSQPASSQAPVAGTPQSQGAPASTPAAASAAPAPPPPPPPPEPEPMPTSERLDDAFARLDRLAI